MTTSIDYNELNAFFIEQGLKIIEPDESIKLRILVDKGWRECYTEWFGQSFVDALAPHHIEAVEWHWDSRLKFVKGEKPAYLAYFPIWSRGHLKSSIAERLVIVDAMISTAYKTAGYALYLSANKEKVQEHVANIETLMSSEGVRKWNAKLATPQRTEITNQQRKWTASFLKTDVNYSIQGGTLESGLAGSRVDETRPTFIIPDDVDGREDSPVIAESRLRQFTTGILPMRQDNTLVFFAQNLISRYSMMYRIHKGHSRVLTNRKPSDPVPAVRNLVTEQRVVDGIIKDVYVSGEPTWHVWDVQRIQDEIDTEGLESFKKECLHLVDEDKSGNILYNYDDDVHVISESEFEAVYGKNAWKYWRKKCGNDWARTKTDKHANVADWWCISDSSSPLPNITFMMYPMSFPPNSAPEDVAERLLSCLSPYAYETAAQGKVTWADLRRDITRKTRSDVYTSTVAEQVSYEHGELAKIIPKYSAPLLQQYNVMVGEMSHEQDTVRKIYSSVYGLALKGVNPRKHGGTELWNRLLRIDRDLPHPFRPNQKGYSQWYMVVPDDKNAEYREVDGLKIYPPKPKPVDLQTKDMEDDDLARFQLANCRYRPPKLTEAGEEIDNPEKIYDDFFNCFIAGTQISTATGLKNIEDIQIGEEVWTRQGLRPVGRLFTKSEVEVWQVDFSDGKSLVATPDHPIYVNDTAFTPLQMLKMGDTVEVWQTSQQKLSQNASFLTGLPFTDTLKQNNIRTENILQLISVIVKKGLATITLNCGNLSMAMSLMATKFITKMAIPLTTTFPTLRLSLSPHIGLNTLNSEVQPPKERLVSPTPAHSIITNGIKALKGVSFLRNKHKSPENNWKKSVNIASEHIQLSSQQADGVGMIADNVNEQERHHDLLHRTFLKSVKNVIKNFWQGQPFKSSAPKVVVSKIQVLVEKQSVYNLSVTDIPEYYANGILVHNCGQMHLVGGQLTGTSLTMEQKIQMTMPSGVVEAFAKARSSDEKWAAQMQYDMERREAEERLGLWDEEDEWE